VTLGEVVSMCRNDVDLMKIDIEGQEYEVLVRGDVEPLRKVRRLVLEYDAFDPSEPTIGPEAIIDRLASLGFAAAYSKASRGSGRLIYATRQ
jgi:hypothetical protein